MSRTGCDRRPGRPARLAPTLGLALAAVVPAMAQDGPQQPPITSAPAAVAAPAPAPGVAPPGTAVTLDDPAEAVPGLPADIQVVRFQGPEGVKIEVLGPDPEPVPQGDGKGLIQVGLKVGVGYRLRITDIPERPGVELFPVIEVVGHLHRPSRIDPGKFPIRVVFALEDLYEAADRARLVTQVVYLEDPDQAVPIRLDKDTPPSLNLNPAEEPLKVAAALGRVMAIVRLGLRKPLVDELGLPSGDGLANGPCPFTITTGERCGLPCGPVCGTRPPADRPWLPRDEYLCDGGDHAMPIHFGGDGGLRGIDPRDAMVEFHDNRRPRVLPTNTVCIYAPRFASVRVSAGANESLNVQHIKSSDWMQRPEAGQVRQGPKRLDQNTALEANRLRSRASGLVGKVYAGEHSELRVLGSYDVMTHINSNTQIEGPENLKVRAKAVIRRSSTPPIVLNKAESLIMTGFVQGAGQMLMTWTPRELAGVETPPNKPGLSVIKQVDVDQAEPGDTVTYTIKFRNMGNSPIRAVSIVDSLLPRLEYVAKSATGPAGTVFSAGENKAGSLELRWDLPDALMPGVEGTVTFKAVVR
nr:hypothetical protein Hi04_10k_c4998_00012 [uncultured bacterium]